MRVKGALVRTRFEYLVERFGPAAPQRLLSALSEDDRRSCERVLPASWVPFALITRVDERLVELFHGNRVEAAAELGAFSARRNLTTLYKLFVEQAARDPHLLLRSLAQLHGTFYDWGLSRTVRVGPCEGRMEADYGGGAQRLNCMTAMGFYAEALRLIELPGVQARELACQVGGAPLCLVELRWTAPPA